MLREMRREIQHWNTHINGKCDNNIRALEQKLLDYDTGIESGNLQTIKESLKKEYEDLDSIKVKGNMVGGGR